MTPTPTTDSNACPQAADMNHRHLQGVWHTDLPSHGGATVLRLGQHPELAGSVRGTLERAGRTVQVTGDVHEGVLTLEESMDGEHISAAWLGDVVEDRCGKEISGFWSTADAAPDASIPFVLRKQAVWQ
ncbi:hypothetical protein [Simplicispira psychrophila]|uniref:hypothetical protein n=1 Tax=Simplicispira psychrophila TaxID=80882 RepID=UPI001FDEF145|nr:hypothetical protein [Simplicispira psychrophila]